MGLIRSRSALVQRLCLTLQPIIKCVSLRLVVSFICTSQSPRQNEFPGHIQPANSLCRHLRPLSCFLRWRPNLHLYNQCCSATTRECRFNAARQLTCCPHLQEIMSATFRAGLSMPASLGFRSLSCSCANAPRYSFNDPSGTNLGPFIRAACSAGKSSLTRKARPGPKSGMGAMVNAWGSCLWLMLLTVFISGAQGARVADLHTVGGSCHASFARQAAKPSVWPTHTATRKRAYARACRRARQSDQGGTWYRGRWHSTRALLAHGSGGSGEDPHTVIPKLWRATPASDSEC